MRHCQRRGYSFGKARSSRFSLASPHPRGEPDVAQQLLKVRPLVLVRPRARLKRLHTPQGAEHDGAGRRRQLSDGKLRSIMDRARSLPDKRQQRPINSSRRWTWVGFEVFARVRNTKGCDRR